MSAVTSACDAGRVTDEVLAIALEPVLRDLEASGLSAPEVEDTDWLNDPDKPSAVLRSPDGSTTGVYVSRSSDPSSRVVGAADTVQEWVLEELWGRPWPECPRHPGSHPMEARASDSDAMWCCPADEKPVRAVGSL